jgi:GTP-sensing pleiotropic transcriptional regulator CodY
MSDPSNNSQNNEQILNDIQLLQQMEQQLFNNLETNSNLSVEQQQQINELKLILKNNNLK